MHRLYARTTWPKMRSRLLKQPGGHLNWTYRVRMRHSAREVWAQGQERQWRCCRPHRACKANCINDDDCIDTFFCFQLRSMAYGPDSGESKLSPCYIC